DQPRDRADRGRRWRLSGSRSASKTASRCVHAYLDGRRREPGVSGGPRTAGPGGAGGGHMSGGSSRMPLIAGNWKMHYNHLEALALVQKLAFALKAKDYAATEVVVLPPFTALRSVQTLVMGDKLDIRYGAQDISQYDDGAYTGDVSGSMLAK